MVGTASVVLFPSERPSVYSERPVPFSLLVCVAALWVARAADSVHSQLLLPLVFPMLCLVEGRYCRGEFDDFFRTESLFLRR